MKPIPCRQAITGTLLKAAQQNKDIFVVTSDARGSVTLTEYAKALPDQFVEVGIAEQNAVGIGAGLALTGKNVFVCGPACFYSARSLEQIKVDVAYTQTNVKIIGVSGGVSYGALGSTHHSLHDIAVMRTFPGINVYLPSDEHQSAWLTMHLAQTYEAAYVRVGRNAVPEIYKKDTTFFPGKAKILQEGTDIAIIASGETVYHALMAGKKLAEEGISAMVIDMFTIKPLDVTTILYAAKKTGLLLTVEEHSIFGGLGAAIAEVVCQNTPVKMKVLGIPDENAIHGKPLEIFEYYGLTRDGIHKEAKKLLTQKQKTHMPI